MFLRFTFVLAMLPFSVPSTAAPRVILVSWDGAGYDMTSKLLAEGRLPNLQRMLREGAWSDGMVSSFPTKTAAAHAVLFTGHYGHRSGITANRLLSLPESEHDRTATENGYFSNALRVDPVWILAARHGLDAYAMHATQAYPFDHARARLSPIELEHLFLIHGYTEIQSRGESFDEASVRLEAPAGWAVPEAWGSEARAFRFEVGETPLWGLFFDDPLDPVSGWDTLGIVSATAATVFEARVKPGRGFSTPIEATAEGKSIWFSLRIFDLSADGRHFLLYRSGAAEMAVSNSEMPRADLPVMQVYAGNGATRPYSRGGLGPRLADSGDGLAEVRLLETLAHLQSQIIAQAKVALEEDYDLVVLYSPVTDDVNHELVGYLDPTLKGHDEAVAARLWPFIVQGFELQDTFLGVLMDAAERDDAHVVVVSDHGMAGTDRLLHLNVALAQAGLLALQADGSIDLSATRALAPSLADGSIAVNLTGRAGGIVRPEEREEVLREVRRALGSLQDPETGEPIVTAFYDPATSGLLQPGGASTGHLFLDYLPGYYPSTGTRGDAVVESTEPRGNHVFVPTRRNMLAICAAWGPRIPSGTNFGKVRSIDVVPTVLDLLELERSADLPGRSLVPPATLLNATPPPPFPPNIWVPPLVW